MFALISTILKTLSVLQSKTKSRNVIITRHNIADVKLLYIQENHSHP